MRFVPPSDPLDYRILHVQTMGMLPSEGGDASLHTLVNAEGKVEIRADKFPELKEDYMRLDTKGPLLGRDTYRGPIAYCGGTPVGSPFGG